MIRTTAFLLQIRRSWFSARLLNANTWWAQRLDHAMWDFRRRKTVDSHWGCPVPRVVKTVSSTEISNLIVVAKSRDFSRIARDLEIRNGWTYFLIPYLPEPSPETCWICLIVGVKKLSAQNGGV